MALRELRPGVIFEESAASSFQRLESEVGFIPCNSTWRDPVLQLSMHLASVAYENGTGPYPGHSYAAHPDFSYHCKGRAFDSNRSLAIRQRARRHGWRHVTRANEEHHLEYYEYLDLMRFNNSLPAGEIITVEEEEEMTSQFSVARPLYKHENGLFVFIDPAARTYRFVVANSWENVLIEEEQARVNNAVKQAKRELRDTDLIYRNISDAQWEVSYGVKRPGGPFTRVEE